MNSSDADVSSTSAVVNPADEDHDDYAYDYEENDESPIFDDTPALSGTWITSKDHPKRAGIIIIIIIINNYYVFYKIIVIVLNCNNCSTVVMARRNAIKQSVAMIASAVNEVDDLNALERVLTLLTKASDSLDAATLSCSTVLVPFDKKDHFGPTQKNETQLRFKQTIAKPGRKPQLLPIGYYCKIVA